MADVNNFSSIKIGIASPEAIKAWSHGEVTKSETINYRTQKPEKGGLFCERIFGPVKDYECSCGRYKKNKAQKGITCDKCGVDVVKSTVRRERMGHIELACPVTHIWYLKGAPYRISQLLDIPLKELEQVVYYSKFIVLDKGNTDLEYKQIIDYRELMEKQDEFGETSFKVGDGGEAIRQLLSEIDIEKEYQELRKIVEEKEGIQKQKAIKKLEVVSAFRNSNNKPEWMVLTVLPVLPPDLRPMVPLDGGRYAASDLNDLYRRVIMRNTRLKKILEDYPSEIIVRSEKRMLQEAVDALIDNGRRGKPVMLNNRKVKSLTEMLKGKQGRFRLNLLGKRVDYSGRSVIVIGPELKMYQCGIPKEMAIELFKPFVIKELIRLGHCQNIKSAKRLMENNPKSYVWDILEDVIKDHPVLLNRAPSLHRLSIQAFEPVLVEGRAIKLHPLVCTAFNADFDGDQMAVHVPLSLEARAEARFLMLSTNNILKLSDGKPVVSPSQDIVIGCYYLTMKEEASKALMAERRVFKSVEEALMAYQLKQISLQREIEVRVEKLIDGVKYSKRIKTTVGKIIFNQAIPQDLGFTPRTTPEEKLDLEINFVVDKGGLSKIVDRVFKLKGATETAVVLDKIKALGYKYSTVGAITASVFDMHVPAEKQDVIKDAQGKVIEIEKAARKGKSTEEERYTQTVKTWTEAKEKIINILKHEKDIYNPIWMMAESGARGGMGQISQLCGMRGLVSSTSGKDIELPIKSAFAEGLSVLEYFISAHGGRKGMADTALKTAESGYLTRRLVDVCHHVVVYEEDCGDTKGIEVKNEGLCDLIKVAVGKKCEIAKAGDEVLAENVVVTEQMALDFYAKKIDRIKLEGEDETPFNLEKTNKAFIEKIDGRFAIGDICNPQTGEIIVENDTMISPDQAVAIKDALVKSIRIRSNLTCKCKNGVCAKCYGKNMASGNIVKIGEAVGIIAAQSIGEPGTQLTMRTFHTGGVASSGDITNGLPRVEELFEVRKPKGQAIISDIAGKVEFDESNPDNLVVKVVGKDKFSGEIKEEKYNLYNTKPVVKNGQMIEAGDRITKGSIYPQDLLRTKGVSAAQDYIIKEVKETYNSSNAEINEKHLEIIVRQMLRKVVIRKSGTTDLLVGDVVDEQTLFDANAKIMEEENCVPAQGQRILQSITRASLTVDSFLSAASFQETAKMLADAAMKGKVDHLKGLKENIIIGKLIPAGTGTDCYKNIETVRKASDINRIVEDDTSSLMERTEENL